ncbi:glycosyltransferase family 87 protein [Propionibacteriaceae bacterium Y1700]|uniref:glycosyltransferase family 87 protein n=1 Tax=Microlunatus sp. Y1700 TaxID=3418487 RepID=UPI003DA7653E
MAAPEVGRTRSRPNDATVIPSRVDPVARAASQAAGGPYGRRARGWTLLTPGVIAVLVATVTWVIGAVQKLPCRYDKVGKSVDWFAWMCYSDIPLLYRYRGLADGNTPLLDTGDYQVLEYPVLTGGLLEFQRWITVALGAPVGPGLSEQQALDAAILFFDINVVVLFCCFLVAVVAQVWTPTGRPWDGLMLAASPAIVLTALINWDMFPMALTAVGCLLWAKRMPTAAGVLLGLGMAAKLYPLLLLGPLLFLCLRSNRLQEFLRTLGAFLISWAVTNLPIMFLAPEQWKVFWTFNSDRQGDLGSIWYVYKLITDQEFPALNAVNMILLLAGCAAIALLIMVAPRRPRFAQVAYLVLFVFLLLNKVYSPQYVLWLLPFMIMARPQWRDWIVFHVGECCYTLAIWGHLGGFTEAGGGGDRLYWLAVIVRVLCEAWIAVQIVRDVVQPEHDPVRIPGVDDPGGGVLDGAPDAPWFRRMWDRNALSAHG